VYNQLFDLANILPDLGIRHLFRAIHVLLVQPIIIFNASDTDNNNVNDSINPNLELLANVKHVFAPFCASFCAFLLYAAQENVLQVSFSELDVEH